MNIDIFKESSAGRTLRFSFKMSDLPRALETLPDSVNSELKVFLSFGVDENAQSYVDVNLEGTLLLRCQRCLELMPFQLETSHRLSPIEIGQKDDLLGDIEPILMDENGLVCVADMVEDEILLGLPMCPMHLIEDCPSQVLDSQSLQAKPETRKSFAGLADLLNKKSV